MLIQFHMLQNYAPANLNRDDTGAPKDCYFGGVKRGRISSQCLKRSMRQSATFRDAFGKEGLLATRTRSLPTLIDQELGRLGADNKARQAIVMRIPEIGTKGKAKDGEDGNDSDSDEGNVGETRQMFFLGGDEIRPLAEKLLRLYQEKDAKGFASLKIADLEKELQHDLPRSVDIALFGRMTTSVAFENVQASVQVAHAISTHALTQEFDYFTAIDDISGQSGAGMIGDTEYNSSTYYKYLNIHWEELVKNLGGDKEIARRTVAALLTAAAMAQPGGKQNGFAAFNLPDFILVETSDKNLPVSYANAFIKPMRGRGDQSLMDVSIEKLGEYMQRLDKVYNLNSQKAYMTTTDMNFPVKGKADSLGALEKWLITQLPE